VVTSTSYNEKSLLYWLEISDSLLPFYLSKLIKLITHRHKNPNLHLAGTFSVFVNVPITRHDKIRIPIGQHKIIYIMAKYKIEIENKLDY
jgi:hypothetical protein